MIHGRKTKSACVGMLVAAAASILMPSSPVVGQALFMASTALAFYGLYDRNARTSNERKEQMDTLNKKIKKPMLRSSV